MKTTSAALLALLLTAGSMAETHLDGNLAQNTVLEKAGNPYIVDQDYIVPVGKELTLKQGCVLLFKAFTGMRVEGKLVVEGTTEEPVVFTSQYDADYNPKSTQLANPFDWNGVIILKTAAGTVMNNFVLRYSAYGINAQNPNVIVRNGDFRQNGQLHFTIDGKTQYVQDGVPFSYGASAAEPAPTSTQATSSEQSPGKKQEPRAKKSAKTGTVAKQKKVFRFACLGVGVVGLAVGTPLIISVGKDWSEMRDLAAKMDAVALNSPERAKYSREYDSIKKSYTGKMAAGIIGETLGVLGLVGFGLTFAF
jgi:hypothetical protein